MTSLDGAIATMRQALAYHVDAAERIRRALAELEDLDTEAPAASVNGHVEFVPPRPPARANGGKRTRHSYTDADKRRAVADARQMGAGRAAVRHGVLLVNLRRWLADPRYQPTTVRPEGLATVRPEGLAPPFDGEIAEDLKERGGNR